VEKPVREDAANLLAVMKKSRGVSESLRLIQGGKVSFISLYITIYKKEKR
jgi:hypothetical protein